MKSIAIIAEYNPFHNGHLYQIMKSKELTGADHVVVLMSGDFMQRGTPAVLDKYARTKMALSHGADVVLELPCVYATASAEGFAFGAVSILNRLGIIDYLCFGSECGDLAVLDAFADILNTEPAFYRSRLQQYIKEGNTFPQARAAALLDYLSAPDQNAMDCFLEKLSSSMTLDAISDILSSPNNILGIEYLKALKKSNSTIQPVTIRREGAGYHDTVTDAPICSATAIRSELNTLSSDMWTLLANLPAMTNQLLTEQYGKTCPVTADDFSSLLYYKLTGSKDHLTRYADVNADLANRITNLMRPGITFDAFCEELKTKQMTLTRISRALLHILLDIRLAEYKKDLKDEICYARILGFKKTSSHLLRAISAYDRIPVIVKVADAVKLLNEREYQMFCHDIDASHLYHQIVYHQYHTLLPTEYQAGPVIL